MEQETCIACGVAFVEGDRYLPDNSGGSIHFDCCGPERESYCNAECAPLGPDEAIPEPLIWSADPRTARDWYVSTDGGGMWHTPGTREAAIDEGLRSVAPGETFLIAQAAPKGPWPTLFDADDLYSLINDQNEDNAFEDAFTDEAAISTADLAALAADINAVWSKFLTVHQPTSNLLDVGPTNEIIRPAEEAHG